ncbi:MAG: flagellar cap protein FliD N-terminal domain-containing protein, partial [Acidobacteriota bacterium]
MSSSVSPLAQSFTGVSKFATSLQSVLSRAVSIASLPLDSLSAGLNTLASKQAALQGLETPFLSLQNAIGTLQNTVKSGLLNSSVSDAGIVTATVQPGALAGSYSIEVESLGSSSTALSNSAATPVTDPAQQSISDAATLTLQVGAVSTTITPASSTLQGLVAAINTQAGDQVQATLVNVGSGSSPDYRLSLRAVNLGADAIDLTDGTGTLISTSTTGSLASYKVAGLSTSITSASRTVTLAPGLTVNLTGQSAAGQATTINV